MKPTRSKVRDGKWLEPMGRAQHTIQSGLDRAVRKREARRELDDSILDRPVTHKPRLERLFAEDSVFDA